MRPEDQGRVVAEVIRRVYGQQLSRGDAAVEDVLLDAAWYEIKRLSAEPASIERDDGLNFWRHAQQEILRVGSPAQQELLEQVIRLHAEEICGKFNHTVYRLSTRVVPQALNLMLNSQNPGKILRNFPRLPELRDTLVLQGQTVALQRLVQKGVVVLVPTHFSHLDSIVVGWAINELKLPPFTYGAGINLFTNPVLSYFMHNLGAYKVDRKKKHDLYKDVLKTYCTVSLENNYNNLFFPGGTRSRNGAVERKLKLGLLGCGLEAYIHNLQQGRVRPKVFIVPATLSYQLVLEAETLIEDYLQETGKSRFIIEDDEFSEPRKVLQFATNMVNLESRIYIDIGQALDPFGNRVDQDGVSHDGQGRPIDIERYVTVDGAPAIEPDRDREYTRHLGQSVVRELHRCNVIQSTHLLAFVVWKMLRSQNPRLDLYRLLRTGGRVQSFPVQEVVLAFEQALGRLTDLAGKGELKLAPNLRPGRGAEVLEDGLRHFSTYHSTPVVERQGEHVVLGPRSLIYYYQHRLDGYGI